MIFEISQQFYFEAAHTLERSIAEEADGSRRYHGHTYHAEVTVAGRRDEATGMVVDLGLLRREIDAVRDALDHRLLDEVPALGSATLENLCAFIAQRFEGFEPRLASVRVWREASGDSCLLRLAPR